MKAPDYVSYSILFDALSQRVLSCEEPFDVEYCFDLMCVLVRQQEDLLVQLTQNAVKIRDKRGPSRRRDSSRGQ